MKIKTNGSVNLKGFKMLVFYLISFSGWIVLFITFLHAYFNSSKMVTIDSLGEANPELFLVVGVTVFCCYGIVVHVKEMLRCKGENERV